MPSTPYKGEILVIESKTNFIPQNPDFEHDVRTSFSQQSVMDLIGAEQKLIATMTATMVMIKERL